MQAPALTEWLNSPGTQALRAYLRHRKNPVLSSFLAGSPVQPEAQGRAAAFHELETLLAMPSDEVGKIFETALREHKTT